MTASETAKRAGLKNLAAVSELTGVSVQTLNNWFRHKPKLFAAAVAGCRDRIAIESILEVITRQD